MHSRCLAFFSFKFVGGGIKEFFFFSFFPGSQCVPTMFHLSSQWDLSDSQYVPQVPNVFLNMQ